MLRTSCFITWSRFRFTVVLFVSWVVVLSIARLRMFWPWFTLSLFFYARVDVMFCPRDDLFSFWSVVADRGSGSGSKLKFLKLHIEQWNVGKRRKKESAEVFWSSLGPLNPWIKWQKDGLKFKCENTNRRSVVQGSIFLNCTNLSIVNLLFTLGASCVASVLKSMGVAFCTTHPVWKTPPVVLVAGHFAFVFLLSFESQLPDEIQLRFTPNYALQAVCALPAMVTSVCAYTKSTQRKTLRSDFPLENCGVETAAWCVCKKCFER